MRHSMPTEHLPRFPSKTCGCIFFLFNVFLFPLLAHAQLAPAVKIAASSIDEVIEAAAKVSGRALPSEARAIALRELSEASLRHGNKALAAARTGGLELIELAAKHGDEVWEMTAKVPGSARLMATRADELLPLTRRIGTEVLELEVKNPGIAKVVAREFGDDAVRQLARNSSPEDVVRLTGFAKHADNPATKKLLLEKYLDGGADFLARLPAKHILAAGLTASMIIATLQVSDGVQEGLKTVAKESPETFSEVVRSMAFWVVLPFVVLGVGWAILRLRRMARKDE